MCMCFFTFTYTYTFTVIWLVVPFNSILNGLAMPYSILRTNLLFFMFEDPTPEGTLQPALTNRGRDLNKVVGTKTIIL